ncbi:MAG: hypothetical protein A3J74_04735, partial [Elusimicrobia bacterium RIFCSPHIGHO2_02_FULL_57_9]
ENYKFIRQVDVAAISGPDIATDLSRRDFTINALALPLGYAMSATVLARQILDPRKGLADISRGLLRAESGRLFKDDPLRLLRAFRIAAQLNFKIEPGTLRLIGKLRNLARRPAGERISAELLALLALPGSSRWLKLMDECRLLTSLFKALEPARRCALVYYGPGGVLRHSLETAARADFLLHHLKQVFPAQAKAIAACLESNARGGAAQSAVLMLAALLHDIAKPATAKKREGRLRFFGHDARGAKKAAEILRGLKFSRHHIETVSTVIAQHLRPGNLAASGVVTDKAAYRFFRDLGDKALSLLLVCWADHASYLPQRRLLKLLNGGRAKSDEEKTMRHLQVVSHLIARLWAAGPKKPIPERIIDGHDVMKALKIPPGPLIGKLLEQVREAQAEGKIRNRAQALVYLRKNKDKIR